MERHHLPGGALAISKDGKLVYARGFGYADVENKVPVDPDSLFRIASLTKPITAVAVMKLVERGKLNLDSPAFSLLPEIQTELSHAVDPRIRKVTVRQLLHHTGGWDRNASFDPMFRPIVAAKAVNAPAPASCSTVIRYMMTQKLDFDPGHKYAYSNFGYCVLGRIIEQLSGTSYEQFVKRELLSPLAVRRMKEGASLRSDQVNREVRYYDYPDAPKRTTVFPRTTEEVVAPYGSFNLEAMDSHGGWIASAIDLVQFANAIDGRAGKRYLKPESVKTMLERPAHPVSKGAASWYALGWMVRPVGNDSNWWHAGSLPGTTTLLVRTHNGYAWAALFNSRPNAGNLGSELDAGLWRAFEKVTTWPAWDLLPRFR
jgi:N-acyl-D-amino-acid deacylase